MQITISFSIISLQSKELILACPVCNSAREEFYHVFPDWNMSLFILVSF